MISERYNLIIHVGGNYNEFHQCYISGGIGFSFKSSPHTGTQHGHFNYMVIGV